jgi:hypothetical protein
MSAMLDKRIGRGGCALWTTVEKDGKRWTVQAFILPDTLERMIASSIEENLENHVFVEGALSIGLTRQL